MRSKIGKFFHRRSVLHHPESPEAAAGSDAKDPVSRLIAEQTVSERLWNDAYDQLKNSEQKIVNAYEQVMSHRLDGGDDQSAGPETQTNKISQNKEERSDQMNRLVQDGLQRTQREAEVKGKVQHGIDAILTIRSFITAAVQASPQAAVAWVGVCFALEILMSPLVQASANREGLQYVVGRMDWYWHLFDLLLHPDLVEKASRDVRRQLENHIVDLYKSLLLYQMKSVCYYFQNRGSAFLRDLFRLDKWDTTLTGIKAAEEVIRRDSKEHNLSEVLIKVDKISKQGAMQVEKLSQVVSGIQGLMTQQENLQRTSEDNKLMSNLRITDPRDDKKSIEDRKGGLFEDSYQWILQHEDYREWRDTNRSVLWIRGDPGQGKTMLLCGIINELKVSKPHGLLTYFFCQTADGHNSATAVLRGLLYAILDQRTSLIAHARRFYDRAQTTAFTDQNAFYTLESIMIEVLKSLDTATIMIDALDECLNERKKLLKFIVEQSSAFPRVKWVISSRKWPEIETKLTRVTQLLTISLDSTSDSLRAAVGTYIEYMVKELASEEDYEDKDKKLVREHLSSKADGTFLWVALVCQSLKGVKPWRLNAQLSKIPSELDDLYRQRISQIIQEGGDEGRRVLATMAIAHRPLNLRELAVLDEELFASIGGLKNLQRMIETCHSFVTIKDDIVYFVHQSAKDFLLGKTSKDIFPDGKEDEHQKIVAGSLKAMTTVLCRDMYRTDNPAALNDNLERPDPNPLAAVAYSCTYWIDHVLGTKSTLLDDSQIHCFLKTHFLHWLEAVSLINRVPGAVQQIATLTTIIDGSKSPDLFAFIYDAWRFTLRFSRMFTTAPLQLYCSALVFAPMSSIVRSTFQHEALTTLTLLPDVISGWGIELLKLEGHDDGIKAVAFSPNGKLLASASEDKTVRIWDVTTGEQRLKLEGHDGAVNSVIFSPNGKLLASASDDRTVRIWDVATGEQRQKLEGHDGPVKAVAFSLPKSKQLASASEDRTVRIWDVAIGEQRLKLEGYDGAVDSVIFSPDGKLLASALDDRTVRIWDAATGEQTRKLEGHDGAVNSVIFSRDGKLLVSALDDRTVRIWDVAIGEQRQKLKGHKDEVYFMTFSPNGKLLASASGDRTVRIWDTATGEQRQKLKGHKDRVYFVIFSPDGKLLASESDDRTVRIWDVATGEQRQKFEGKDGPVEAMAFSPDGKSLRTSVGELRLVPDGASPDNSLGSPTAIQLNDEWLCCEGRDILWLPDEYRGSCSAAFGNTLAIGHGYGAVVLFKA